jgi:hypothetical protein
MINRPFFLERRQRGSERGGRKVSVLSKGNNNNNKKDNNNKKELKLEDVRVMTSAFPLNPIA